MDFQKLEQIVNPLVVMGFLSIFGYIYCSESRKTSFVVKPTFGFSPSFISQEKKTFTELKTKVEEGLVAVQGVEARFKNLEAFIGSGDLTEYKKALDE
jgi:hypothetical protein